MPIAPQSFRMFSPSLSPKTFHWTEVSNKICIACCSIHPLIRPYGVIEEQFFCDLSIGNSSMIIAKYLILRNQYVTISMTTDHIHLRIRTQYPAFCKLQSLLGIWDEMFQKKLSQLVIFL